MKPRVVTIFGTGQVDDSYPEYQTAVLIGRMLAGRGFVICNGGYGGIMEATARGAKEAGGRTIGITAKELKGKANRWIDEERQAATWRERIFGLIDAADAYLVFDGGTGTLAEVFVVWESMNKNFFARPMILFGPRIRRLAEHVRQWPQFVSNPFAFLAETPEQILQYLKSGL